MSYGDWRWRLEELVTPESEDSSMYPFLVLLVPTSSYGPAVPTSSCYELVPGTCVPTVRRRERVYQQVASPRVERCCM